MTGEDKGDEHRTRATVRDPNPLERRVRDDPMYWEALGTRIHDAARARGSLGVVPRRRTDETGWLAARAGTLLVLAVGAAAAAMILAVQLRPQVGDRSDGQRMWANALSSGSSSGGVAGMVSGDQVAPSLAALLLANDTPRRSFSGNNQ